METIKNFFVFNVTLTWSKLMALILAAQAFTLDILYDKQGTVFMFTIPFVVFLITGKQAIDRNKGK